MHRDILFEKQSKINITFKVTTIAKKGKIGVSYQKILVLEIIAKKVIINKSANRANFFVLDFLKNKLRERPRVWIK